jgi:putative transposase
MTWKQTDPMNERVKFIGAYLEAEETFSDLCERFEVSRKTGYQVVLTKWETRGDAQHVESQLGHRR